MPDFSLYKLLQEAPWRIVNAYLWFKLYKWLVYGIREPIWSGNGDTNCFFYTCLLYFSQLIILAKGRALQTERLSLRNKCIYNIEVKRRIQLQLDVVTNEDVKPNA